MIVYWLRLCFNNAAPQQGPVGVFQSPLFIFYHVKWDVKLARVSYANS